MSDCWQHLMNQAYDKWQQTWSYRQFLLNLDEVERKAVILGNLHYQVGNGGLQQWVDNGYASSTGRDVLIILDEIGTAVAGQVKDLVEKCLAHVNMGMEKTGFGENYWIEEWDCDDPPACYEEVDKLTDDYYKLEGFEADVERYLVGPQKMEVA